jgi:hypothetical protein
MPWNVDQLRASHGRLLTAHQAMVGGILYEAGVQALAETILHPGFKPRTGKTQKATTFRLVRTRGGKVVRVENKAPVARLLEGGTFAHIIRARNTRFLRFVGRDGSYVFRRQVRHPGTKPYWFLRRATNVAYATAEQRLLNGMRRVASETR